MQDDLIGQKLGNYEIRARISQGGMAVVYRARQESVQRDVAVKVMTGHLMADPTFHERFKREVRVIARLEHPRILPVYDYGEWNGRPYIVMAYMSGGTLADVIHDSHPMPLQQAVDLLAQIAEGLDYAHRQGVIHRDFKPSNVLIDRNGNAHLADFGIAKISDESTSLTGDRVIGTLGYMAPEMFSKQPLTPSVDVYAVGVTLYQMLTGELPFQGETAQIIGGHLREPVPDVRELRPDIPDTVTQVIRMAMAKTPAQRYASVGALAADLKRAVAGHGGTLASRFHPLETDPISPLPAPGLPQTLPDPYAGATPLPYQPPVGYTPPPYPAPPLPRQRGMSAGVGLLIGGGVAALALVCVVGGLLVAGIGGGFIGGGDGGQVDAGDSGSSSGGNDEGGGEVDEPAEPTAQRVVITTTDAPIEPPTGGAPTDPPTPTSTERPTETPASSAEIEQAVLDYDREVRHLLETGDTSRIATEAKGKALDDRLSAAATLKAAGDCHWRYDHRGLTVHDQRFVTPSLVYAIATVDRSGTVICPEGERPQYAFEGPYEAIYVVEWIDNHWWVIDYCPYDDCPPEMKD